jgi:hypothetical protein
VNATSLANVTSASRPSNSSGETPIPTAAASNSTSDGVLPSAGENATTYGGQVNDRNATTNGTMTMIGG